MQIGKKKLDVPSKKVPQHSSSDKNISKEKNHLPAHSQGSSFFKRISSSDKLSHHEPKLWRHENDEELEKELEEKEKKEEKLVRPSRRTK